MCGDLKTVLPSPILHLKSRPEWPVADRRSSEAAEPRATRVLMHGVQRRRLWPGWPAAAGGRARAVAQARVAHFLPGTD